jgi:hypothetical protein
VIGHGKMTGPRKMVWLRRAQMRMENSTVKKFSFLTRHPRLNNHLHNDHRPTMALQRHPCPFRANSPSNNHPTIIQQSSNNHPIIQSSHHPSIPDPPSFSNHVVLCLLERPHHSVFLLRHSEPGLEESLSKCAMFALHLLLLFTMASVQKSVDACKTIQHDCQQLDNVKSVLVDCTQSSNNTKKVARKLRN